MTLICTGCRHPGKGDINAALVAHELQGDLAARTSLMGDGIR